MKSFLLKILNKFTLNFGYRLCKAKVFVPPSADLFPIMAMLYIQKGEKLTIVQVGANDGKTHDPIFDGVKKFAKKILLIEPLVELIPLLELNYSSFSGIAIIENCAVGSSIGSIPFYKVSEKLRKRFILTGIDPTLFASFSKEHVINHLKFSEINISDEDVEANIVEDQIQTSTLENILLKHSLMDIDLLQIDCEGFDWQVLKTIGSLRPKVINLEHKHLSVKDKIDLVNWFDQEGYNFFIYNRDCFAIKN